MKIYIDDNYRCHLTNAKGYRAFNVPYFNGKSPIVIEGYRYVPSYETWTREDGTQFKGEMISPAVDSLKLDLMQEGYDVRDVEATEELAAIVDEIYNGDLEAINGGEENV